MDIFKKIFIATLVLIAICIIAYFLQPRKNTIESFQTSNVITGNFETNGPFEIHVYPPSSQLPTAPEHNIQFRKYSVDKAIVDNEIKIPNVSQGSRVLLYVSSDDALFLCGQMKYNETSFPTKLGNYKVRRIMIPNVGYKECGKYIGSFKTSFSKPAISGESINVTSNEEARRLAAQNNSKFYGIEDGNAYTEPNSDQTIEDVKRFGEVESNILSNRQDLGTKGVISVRSMTESPILGKLMEIDQLRFLSGTSLEQIDANTYECLTPIEGIEGHKCKPGNSIFYEIELIAPLNSSPTAKRFCPDPSYNEFNPYACADEDARQDGSLTKRGCIANPAPDYIPDENLCITKLDDFDKNNFLNPSFRRLSFRSNARTLPDTVKYNLYSNQSYSELKPKGVQLNSLFNFNAIINTPIPEKISSVTLPENINTVKDADCISIDEAYQNGVNQVLTIPKEPNFKIEGGRSIINFELDGQRGVFYVVQMRIKNNNRLKYKDCIVFIVSAHNFINVRYLFSIFQFDANQYPSTFRFNYIQQPQGQFTNNILICNNLRIEQRTENSINKSGITTFMNKDLNLGPYGSFSKNKSNATLTLNVETLSEIADISTPPEISILERNYEQALVEAREMANLIIKQLTGNLPNRPNTIEGHLTTIYHADKLIKADPSVTSSQMKRSWKSKMDELVDKSRLQQIETFENFTVSQNTAICGSIPQEATNVTPNAKWSTSSEFNSYTNDPKQGRFKTLLQIDPFVTGEIKKPEHINSIKIHTGKNVTDMRKLKYEIFSNNTLVQSKIFYDLDSILKPQVKLQRYIRNFPHPQNRREMDEQFRKATILADTLLKPNISRTGGRSYLGAIYKGYIRIPITLYPSTIIFNLDSDDASDLIIDNRLVAFWYGGHGPKANGKPGGQFYRRFRKNDIGKLLPFILRFTNNTGGSYLRLYYKIDNGKDEWNEVPSSWYFHTDNINFDGNPSDMPLDLVQREHNIKVGLAGDKIKITSLGPSQIDFRKVEINVSPPDLPLECGPF